MEGKLKTFTYLDLEVYAITKVNAWLLIKDQSEERRIKVPELKEIKLKKAKN